jgi:hypothetical protein
MMAVLVFSAVVMNASDILDIHTPASPDNKILVVTNRAMFESDPGQLVFEPHLDQDLQMSYLTSYYAEGKWTFEKENSLEEMFNQSFNHDDWMVFVHGDGKTLLAAVDRAREIQELHQINVLVFAWPSKDEELGAIKNFKNSYANVEKSSSSFSTFIQDLAELRNDENNPFENMRLTMFLHSLGNYFLVRLIEDQLHDEIESDVFDNLIVNAAAVESEEHFRWIEAIDFSERIYINSNDDDFSLSGLRILTKLGRQLGERAEPPFASNAIYVNFTEAVGFPGSMGPSHSYYFASVTEKSEKIRQYYSTIFHGEKAPLENPDYFAFASEQQAYFIKF